MPEYGIFRLLWWALLGVLLIGIAVMDGFDMGTAILLPIVGRNDMERRIVINTIGPVWEGNQVWLILGAGAILQRSRHSMVWRSPDFISRCFCCSVLSSCAPSGSSSAASWLEKGGGAPGTQHL